MPNKDGFHVLWFDAQSLKATFDFRQLRGLSTDGFWLTAVLSRRSLTSRHFSSPLLTVRLSLGEMRLFPETDERQAAENFV